MNMEVYNVEDAEATFFSQKLLADCRKYRYEGHAPFRNDNGYSFHVDALKSRAEEKYKILIRNKNTYTLSKPEYYIDIGNIEIRNNEEFAEFLGFLKDAQNLVNYLNTRVNWSECPKIRYKEK